VIFQRESAEERLLRFMKIPAKKKLEWLYGMHELMRLTSTKSQRDIFWKLRERGK
jgi:hypothetical protein